MSTRELLLALGLVTAGGLIVRGVALLSISGAWVVAGVLLGALTVLFLVEAEQ